NSLNPLSSCSWRTLVGLPVRFLLDLVDQPHPLRASGRTYPTAKSLSKSSLDSLAPLRIATRTCSSWPGQRCNPFDEVHPLRPRGDFSKRVFRSRQRNSSGTMQGLPVPIYPHQCPCGTSRRMSNEDLILHYPDSVQVLRVTQIMPSHLPRLEGSHPCEAKLEPENQVDTRPSWVSLT